ncbi:hypothetical protein SDJN02_01790, partial [Cucurbita argyrosperma subsp. argyrosperma]
MDGLLSLRNCLKVQLITSLGARKVSLVYNGCAKDAWNKLKERCRQTNGPRISQLCKQLETTVQGTMSVDIPGNLN